LLTVITGYSQWILDGIPPDSPLAENASEILMASNRAAALTSHARELRKQLSGGGAGTKPQVKKSVAKQDKAPSRVPLAPHR